MTRSRDGIGPAGEHGTGSSTTSALNVTRFDQWEGVRTAAPRTFPIGLYIAVSKRPSALTSWTRSNAGT